MYSQTNKLSSYKNMMVPFASAMYALKQANDSYNQTQNECGGILAYISKPAESEQISAARHYDGVSFSKTFANLLTKQPYYQCGVALNDASSN